MPWVALHHAPDIGHKSVTFTTTLFVSFGKKGGSDKNVFSRVRLKHRPQLGPNAALLPYAIWLMAAVGKCVLAGTKPHDATKSNGRV